MSKKKNEKSKFNTYIIPGILLIVVLVAMLVSYGSQMIDSAKNQVMDDYQQDVSEIGDMYQKQIYGVSQVSELTAKEIDSNDIFSEENIKIISIASQMKCVKNIYLVSSDYMAVDAKGKEYSSIIDKPGIVDILEFKNTAGSFYKSEDGDIFLYNGFPIYEDQNIKGFVITEYVPEIMDKLLDNPKYSTRKTYALLSSDGSILESAGGQLSFINDGGNVVDNSEHFIFVNGSYSGFRQALNDCRSGYQRIISNNDNKYLFYAPISGCKGLVLMIVDQGDVDRSHVAVSKTIRRMILGIGVTIIAFLAIFVGIAIFNKAKYSVESEDLQNKADTDQLTDLYNKMATERMIKEYLATEGKNSISMLFVLDVDNFKKINDTMGHAFGDKVLSQLGHQIRAWFRVNDIVGRIGGDEFMVFIKDVKNPDVVRKEGSRIMQFFEGFNVGEYTKYSPTASVGGAIYPTDAKDFESLYKAADKAVYKSKKEGKNRVSFYGDLNALEANAETEKID